jgi:hypothetical protein
MMGFSPFFGYFSAIYLQKSGKIPTFYNKMLVSMSEDLNQIYCGRSLDMNIKAMQITL